MITVLKKSGLLCVMLLIAFAQSVVAEDLRIIGEDKSFVATLPSGETWPVDEADRARVLGALTSVDAVVLFEEDTPIRLIEAMADENIVEHAARMGTDILGPRLREIAERHAVVGEVRGRGVFWAVELVADRQTREPLGAERMAALKKDLLDQGLLGFFAENRLHVVPPAVVTESELDRGLTIIDAALGRLG